MSSAWIARTSPGTPSAAGCHWTPASPGAASVTALSPAGFFRGRGDIVYARSVFRVMQAAGRRR
jgi:hypothetical protein